MLRRAFSVLGPTEAVVEMAAFVTGLWVAGWRPGDAFPTGQPLAAASGAAFAAVVIGQMANAFACRSSRHRPGKVGWGSNRLLLAAVLVELATLAGFLLIGPVARTLGHAWPPAVAGLVALTAAPAVLSVDAIDKWLHARKTAKASELYGEL